MRRTQAAKPVSLRLRLLAGALLWIAVSVLLAGLSLAHLFRQHATAQFRGELLLHLDQLTAAFALNRQGQPELRTALSDPRLAQPFSGLYWQIDAFDAQGRLTQAAALRSRSLWDQSLPVVPEAQQASGEAGDVFHESVLSAQPLLVLARTLTIEDYEAPADGSAQAASANLAHWRLSVAADQQLLAAPIARFDNMLLATLGLLAVCMSLAAVGLVVGGLRPLSLLRRRLTDVAAGREHQIAGGFPAEIQPLVDEFNTVLRLNADMVQRARTQAGNLAHAVKTPLTILDNAARDMQGTANHPLAQLVSEQVQIARRQIDWHLARARAAAAGQASGSRTALHDVLPALVRTMQRLHAHRSVHPDAGHALDIRIHNLPPELGVKGQAQDVQEMLGNLLDNACKWARSRVAVTVAVTADGMDEGAINPHVTLHVDDDGPGLSAAGIAAAFERGVRLDERQPGSGLGLSIAAEMAELYQGRIQAGPSPLGGLRMSLSLPAA